MPRIAQSVERTMKPVRGLIAGRTAVETVEFELHAVLGCGVERFLERMLQRAAPDPRRKHHGEPLDPEGIEDL